METKPAVYLVFWGSQWSTGFTTPDTDGTLYSSSTLHNYVPVLHDVGGSKFAAVQTQYCRNIAAGSTSCAGVSGAQYITNPKGQLKGVWTDPRRCRRIITIGLAENLADDPIAAEAQRAAAHFDYNPQATYIILTPPPRWPRASRCTAATTRRRPV